MPRSVIVEHRIGDVINIVDGRIAARGPDTEHFERMKEYLERSSRGSSYSAVFDALYIVKRSLPEEKALEGLLRDLLVTIKEETPAAPRTLE